MVYFIVSDYVRQDKGWLVSVLEGSVVVCRDANNCEKSRLLQWVFYFIVRYEGTRVG